MCRDKNKIVSWTPATPRGDAKGNDVSGLNILPWAWLVVPFFILAGPGRRANATGLSSSLVPASACHLIGGVRAFPETGRRRARRRFRLVTSPAPYVSRDSDGG